MPRLEALVRDRRERPGQVLSRRELIEVGWPGEQILEAAAMNRLHNGIAVLRSLGLRLVLLTHDDGYLLDPAHL